MGSTWRVVTARVVLVMGSAVATQSAEAQIAPLSLTVVVHAYPALTPSVLERAEGVTTKIYRQIDIQLQWWDANRFATELSNGQVPWARVIHVRLLGTPLSKHADGELGVAVSGGQLASVLVARVEYVASRNGVDFAKLLGHVIAHEMGHLFLPPNSHSVTGIMAAPMDLFRVEHGGLTFDQLQALMIRARLSPGLPLNQRSEMRSGPRGGAVAVSGAVPSHGFASGVQRTLRPLRLARRIATRRALRAVRWSRG